MQKTLLAIDLFQFFQYFQNSSRESCTIESINTYKTITLFDKQFGFQLNTSTEHEHAILQLVKDVSSSFERGEHTLQEQTLLGIFIDLSKAFDNVDHEILFFKLQRYGIKGKTLIWLRSYLIKRKQYICYSDFYKTSICSIICGVPQGSILGLLLFLLYVNVLHKASSILKPVMFADDTNLFLSNKDINKLFHVMNTELQKMSIWLKTNKLSLNLEEQRNCILCTILESSLFCLIQLYVGLHFLQFHLENQFSVFLYFL